MYYFFLLIPLLVFHSFLLLPDTANDSDLPQDLIYNNKPIDTKELLNALCNEGKIDFSKPIEDKEAAYEREDINHFSYDYLGSAGDQHILKTKQYDTSDRKNSVHLLLSVTKNPNGILSFNTIASGVHWEEVFNVHSIINTCLSYSQIRFPDYFMGHLLSRGEDDGWVACCSSTSMIPFEVLYEYDLENFKSKISGLLIPGREHVKDEFNWDFESTHQEGNFFAWALNEVLKEYHEESKMRLNFEEACVFGKRVVNKIDSAKEEFLAQFTSYEFKNCTLPNALLYQGKPVHPAILCNAKEGLFSPVKTYSCSLESPGLQVKGNYVESEYCYPGWGSHTYTVHSSYSYITSYGNKHVLALWHYDDSGTGRFYSLGVFERLKEKQMKVHWLAEGDRFNGVVTGAPELNDNMLRYRRYHTPDWILKHFADYETNVIYAANDPNLVEVLYEIDLKDEDLKVIGFVIPPTYEKEKEPKAIGLTVPRDFEEIFSCSFDVLERTFLSNCYDSVLKRYSDKKERILSVNEAQAFASEIIQELKYSREDYMKKVSEYRAAVEKNTPFENSR